MSHPGRLTRAVHAPGSSIEGGTERGNGERSLERLAHSHACALCSPVRLAQVARCSSVASGLHVRPCPRRPSLQQRPRNEPVHHARSSTGPSRAQLHWPSPMPLSNPSITYTPSSPTIMMDSTCRHACPCLLPPPPPPPSDPSLTLQGSMRGVLRRRARARGAAHRARAASSSLCGSAAD